jgi:serine phosphatase RsbU (regulator of sigma subunit)
LVDRLDIISSVDGDHCTGTPGTVIVAQKWLDSPPDSSPLEYSAWTRPIAGLAVNGDAAVFIEDADGLTVALADGLGHGPEAALASAAAMDLIRRHHGRDFDWLFRRLHGALRHTRGAAITLARIDLARRRLIHGAIGNVAMRVHPAPDRYHAAQPGIVGVGAVTPPKVRDLAWPVGAKLALYSDGIAEGWNLEETAARTSQRASIMCHLIARDHARSSDDATVVVVLDRRA